MSSITTASEPKTVKGRTAAKVAALSAGVFTALMLATGSAHAAEGDTPTTVEGAFDTLSSKVTTYGGAIVGIVVAAALIMLGIKYLRKGVSKA